MMTVSLIFRYTKDFHSQSFCQRSPCSLNCRCRCQSQRAEKKTVESLWREKLIPIEKIFSERIWVLNQSLEFMKVLMYIDIYSPTSIRSKNKKKKMKKDKKEKEEFRCCKTRIKKVLIFCNNKRNTSNKKLKWLSPLCEARRDWDQDDDDRRRQRWSPMRSKEWVMKE